MSTKYLYGASVQGIQGFIFATNKLKEIVGASELVEQICTSFFKDQLGKDYKEENLILGAAGNIKYLFDDEPVCQRLVRNFPKAVMEMAPGITISQAVVKVENNNASEILENRLRTQRNRAISTTNGIGLMVTETARKTGGIGFDYSKDGVIDWGQGLKVKASEKANRKLIKKIADEANPKIEDFPFDISEMVDEEQNKSWIAVIHADGNNLGQKIMQMLDGLQEEQSFSTIRNFSKLINAATIEAAKIAFEKTVDIIPNKTIPFRPVVLGGDDLTAIIRADIAMNFTKVFLTEFENATKARFKNFKEDNGLNENPFSEGITACAGIAYIKASYPFHYGVNLAEKLCTEAKSISKKINKIHTPSSLLFHKVHASFVEDYDDIIDKELSAKDNIQFNFGPYFLSSQSGFSTVDDLLEYVRIINKKDAPKAGLRNWLTTLQNNPEAADQLLDRIKSINKKSERLPLSDEKIFVRRERKKNGEIIQIEVTPIYDIMALSNIQKGD